VAAAGATSRRELRPPWQLMMGTAGRVADFQIGQPSPVGQRDRQIVRHRRSSRHPVDTRANLCRRWSTSRSARRTRSVTTGSRAPCARPALRSDRARFDRTGRASIGALRAECIDGPRRRREPGRAALFVKFAASSRQAVPHRDTENHSRGSAHQPCPVNPAASSSAVSLSRRNFAETSVRISSPRSNRTSSPMAARCTR